MVVLNNPALLANLANHQEHDMPTIPLAQLTSAAADVGRYQAINLILEHLFTDSERTDLVQALARRHLPGMPVPDDVPEPGEDDDATWRPDRSWTCAPGCSLDTDHQGPCVPGAERVPTWHVIRCAMTGERQDPPRGYTYAEPIGVAPHGAGLAVVWRYRA